MVGSPQDIQCIVSTVSGVQLSSVMISWMGPGGKSISSDGRVFISPVTIDGNHFASSLRFSYLMEGDEGIYTCNVMILETNTSDTLLLNTLTGWLPTYICIFGLNFNSKMVMYMYISQCVRSHGKISRLLITKPDISLPRQLKVQYMYILFN